MAFDPITAGLNLGSKLVDTLTKWIPDTAKANEAAAEIAGQFNQLIAGQIELDRIEAASTNKFVSYWRPAIGWVCVGSFGYTVIGHTVFNWAVGVLSLTLNVTLPLLPVPDATLVMEVLFGMLGLGGMRTFEKWKGVSK